MGPVRGDHVRSCAAYPLWSLVLIALYGLVIYGLAAYGGKRLRD